jgi:hypothetical protein
LSAREPSAMPLLGAGLLRSLQHQRCDSY